MNEVSKELYVDGQKQEALSDLNSAVAAKVITYAQRSLALEIRPYESLGKRCGVSEEHAFALMEEAHRTGIVRRLGASFDSAKLGYISCLCALAAPRNRLENIAAMVSARPGVTHNYERDNQFNLWFTVTARSVQVLRGEVASLEEKAGCGEILMLPSTRLFKIRAVFDTRTHPKTSASSVEEESEQHFVPRRPADVVPLTLNERERAVIRVMQQDVSGDIRPFSLIARRSSQLLERPINEQEALGIARRLCDEGALRRMGAIVRHRVLGFSCNAMGVWNIPDSQVERAGMLLSRSKSVSHCYERARCASWPQNVYTMIHGKSRAVCEEAVAAMVRELHRKGIRVMPPELLVSTREFKKVSMRYFEEER